MSIGSAPAGRRPALFVGACAGLLGYSAALLWSASELPFRLPWYEARAHAWALSYLPPTTTSIDFYGRMLLSGGVGLACALVAFVALRKRAIPETLLRAAGVWAVGITLIGMGWYAWAFAHRQVMPPPDLSPQPPPGITAR